jgi:ATP phosphoribosyltransferase regulatory subunit HisZ
MPVEGTRSGFGEPLTHQQAVAERLLRPIHLAGYQPVSTPELDLVELHERKSGAAITARLIELSGLGSQGPVCLRPELTVGVVRSLIQSGDLSDQPLRVHVSGPVYRLSGDANESLVQIDQIGAELLGDGSVEADAEIIALADRCLEAAEINGCQIKIGDVGLILEAITAAGLPDETRVAVIETLADAAAAGHGLDHAESALVHWADWLGDQKPRRTGQTGSHSTHDDHDMHRLFHQLVPHVVGRRTEAEILDRLRQKWELAVRLPDALKKAAVVVHELGSIAGPADAVIDRLQASDSGKLARLSVERISRLIELLNERYGISSSRICLDFSVARGIGFYSGLVFSIHSGESAPVELAGGGRYDGLAGVLGSASANDYGVGFAIGLERVTRLSSAGMHAATAPLIVLQPEDAKAQKAATLLLQKLHAAGNAARMATPADENLPAGNVLVTIAADGTTQVSDENIRRIVERLRDNAK